MNVLELIRNARLENLDFIAITDHQTFRYVESVRQAASSPGRSLVVFPGIEITTVEGVHLLAIFPVSYSPEQATRFVGFLQLSDSGDTAEASRVGVSQILEKVSAEGGIVITPHPFAEKTGLLDSARKMSTRIEWLESGLVRLVQSPEDKVRYIEWDEAGRWTDRYVLASANTDHVQTSTYCLAPLNVSDCYRAEEIGKGCSWFRLGEVSIEGFQQVACKPAGRILRTAPPAETLDAILGLRVSGGYCDGQTLRFSSGLNCIVGQNHAGKSAVLDFIRFALGTEDTAAPDVRASLFSRLAAILGPGGKVELIIRSAGNFYALKRTFQDLKERAKYFKLDGSSGTLLPVEEIPLSVEVYEQGRIHRLRDDVNRQLSMLDEFAGLQKLRRRQDELVGKLNPSANEIEPLRVRLGLLTSEVTTLPALEVELLVNEEFLPKDEEQQSWAAASTAASGLSAVAGVLGTLSERIETPEASRHWEDEDPIWSIFNLEAPAISPEEIAHPEIFRDWMTSLEQALTEIASAKQAVLGATAKLTAASAKFEGQWNALRTEREAQINRELARVGVDSPQELLDRLNTLRTQIHQLKTVKQPQLEQVKDDIRVKNSTRETLLSDLLEIDNQIRNARSAKAQELTEGLGGQIEVALKQFGDRAEYKNLLTSLYNKISSREQQIKNIDAQLSLVADKLTPRELSDALLNKGLVSLRDGRKVDIADFCGVTSHTQSVLCAIAVNVKLLNSLQTARTPDVLQIRVKRHGEPVFADLNTGLSPGEQSAALLTLTLHSRVVPLVLDQPEDELGYNYVVNLIVPKILRTKQNRQMLIVTHNANVPVLGDADYIIKMENKPRAEGGRQCIAAEQGCFESPRITASLLDLEGGKRAFDFRRHRYSLMS
jgi:DNA repair ATPase RecN